VKLPFVSRATYEDLKQLLADERDRTRYLTDLVADMKVGGASLVRSVATDVPEGVKLTPKPTSAINQAVDENKHASRNPRLRAHLVKWAEREIARGQKEEDVLDRLRGWDLVGRDDDDDDDDDDDTVIGV
jgi:hypothetical protein